MIFYAQTYPILNRDLLLTAAIFHDIGKLDELSPFPQNDYTDEGQLLGHITIGGCQGAGAHQYDRGISGGQGERTDPLYFGTSRRVGIWFAKEAWRSQRQWHLVLRIISMPRWETMKEALGNVAEGDLKWQGFNRLFDSNIRKTSTEE